MDGELRERFFQLKLQELLNNATQPFPTYIFEMERPEVIELVRKFCLFSPMMIPFKVKIEIQFLQEELEIFEVIDYGELYVLVNLN